MKAPDEIAAKRAGDEAARMAAAETRRLDRLALRDLDKPAPGVAAPNRPAPYVWTWNRSESAKMGWRGRLPRFYRDEGHRSVAIKHDCGTVVQKAAFRSIVAWPSSAKFWASYPPMPGQRPCASSTEGRLFRDAE